MSLSQSRFSGSVIYDNEQNLLRYYKENITTIAAVRVCAGFYYKITVNEVMPKRDFVFGQVQKKKEDNLALFSISDFDKSRSLYATLKSQIQADKKRL